MAAASAAAVCSEPPQAIPVHVWKKMQKLIMNIMDTINDHTARASVAEREVKLVGDSVGIIGFRCQAIASQLRRCLAASNSDLAKALPSIKGALQKISKSRENALQTSTAMLKSSWVKRNKVSRSLTLTFLEHECVITQMGNAWEAAGS